MSDGHAWVSPITGMTYYTRARITLPDFDSELNLETLVPAQEFYTKAFSVYEGVGGVEGSFEGVIVSGTGWIEQTH